MIDWDKYANFSKDEFDCSHTGDNHMDKVFMDNLQLLRAAAGFPFIVTSGYRAPSHPVERNKVKRGEHTLGLAVDIAINHAEALWVIENARKYNFTRIGVSQKGGSRFLHLGAAKKGFLSPALWSY